MQHPAICVPLSRIELWLTRSAAFWTLGATLCVTMAKGDRQDQWLSTGLDLQLLLAPVCGVDSLLHGWKATSAYLQASSCSGDGGISMSRMQMVMGGAAAGAAAAPEGAVPRASQAAHGAAAEQPCVADLQTVLGHAAASLMMVVLTMLCVRAAVTLRTQQQVRSRTQMSSEARRRKSRHSNNSLF